MTNKQITEALFQIISDCFKLDTIHKKKLNLNKHIDEIYSWSKDTHSLVNLMFLIEDRFKISINDTESVNLYSNKAALSMYFTLIRRKLNKATGT